MTRSFVTKAALAATFVVAVPGAATAQNTVLNFDGAVRVTDPDPTLGVSAGVLNIDFLPQNTGVGQIIVSNLGDNDLVGVDGGDTGVISDLVATPTGLQATPNPFVTLNGYAFTIVTVSDGNVFGPISLTELNLGGGRFSTIASFGVTGTVTGPGFVGTRNYVGSFTSQFNVRQSTLLNRIDRGIPINNAFSATFNIAPAVVPEPSTYALMATGVAMLGAFARRRKQQA